MELFDTTSLLLARAVDGASARQAALADNIANAETPGYQRQDVSFQDALRGAMDSTDPQAALETAKFTATTDPGVMRADGSTVDIDSESAELAQNGLYYQALMAITNGRNDVIRTAIGSA
jgi:flagellar basal-body rod protein FlgB